MARVTFDGRHWSNAEQDRVGIERYDDRWPALFAEEASSIRRVLAPRIVTLEHVGSTAVPGLAAKPILDILLIPGTATGREGLVSPLEALGYVYWADDPRPDRMFFVKGMPPHGARRTHHVHVIGAVEAAPLLLFRDRLRARPEVAARYQRLKYELAARFPTDREAYTRGKDPFVAAELAEALQSERAADHG